MNHNRPRPVCSVCGSDDSERFSNFEGRGFRCRSCGHESIKRERKPFSDNSTESRQEWVYQGQPETF